MNPEKIADMHANLVLADLDAAAENMVDALRRVEDTAAWLVPPHARSDAQEAAVAVFEARRDYLEDAIAYLLHDRHGLLACVHLDPLSI